MKDNYFEKEFDVKHKAGEALYSDDGRLRLVNLGPIAFFSKYKLSSNSRKY